MKYSALLFDLDGTLLHLDTHIFLKEYTKAISSYFSDILDPSLFSKHLWECSYLMIMNKGDKTNKEVFFENFLPRFEAEGDILINRFTDFYKKEFNGLKVYANIQHTYRDLLKKAKEKGYKVVLATNSVFPIEAIESRLGWIELNKENFDLITCYEKMNYCKPNPNYYKQILNYINENPKDCLMIGNDMQEDMVASTLGMGTYLTEPFIIDNGNANYKTNYRGPLLDLFKII